MKTIIRTGQFKKEIGKCKKRKYDLEKLYAVIEMLAQNKQLPPRLRAHKLKGEFTGYLECHIQPDWLLIYKSDAETVYLARTGTHADLFQL